jgi:two-component system, NarL family, nitrate/nitrite response regulator NarP
VAAREPRRVVPETAPADVRVIVGDTRPLIADALGALVSAMAGFLVTDIVANQSDLSTMSLQDIDLLVFGVGMAAKGSLELIRSVRKRAPQLLIVMLVDALTPPVAQFAVDERLNGLLLMGTSSRDLAACLAQVRRGHVVLPCGWQSVLAADQHDALGSLSERQREVLQLVADGLSYEEIGTRLFISVNTVKFHVRSIYSQLGVSNRMAAARLLAQDYS